MRRVIRVGLLSFAILIAGHTGGALAVQPSFDCSKAGAPIEKLICADDNLAALDSTMAVAFRASREGRDDTTRAARLDEQRHWLQTLNPQCRIPLQGDVLAADRPTATGCLADLYKARIGALNAFASAAPATKNNDGAALARSLFPAKGDSETIATITDFGRYSVMVKSDQGTAVQLIDRMAGPGTVDGVAGQIDGRVDAFLDQGDYKIRLHADPRGAGDAELKILPSAELNPTPQQLVELKPIATTLGDHEQRSYWLDVQERRFVILEAAGRHLDDFRLWKDGNWLVDGTPGAGTRDPVGGQPLAIRTLALWLEPGLYRLVAYGGAGQLWSSGSKDKPLYIRYGIPRLPEAGRSLHVASPFGVDRFIVPGTASYFRVITDKPEPTTLGVDNFDQAHPFGAGGDTASITKNSRDPSAELFEGALPNGQDHIVAVQRRPGAPYRLQYFDDRRERDLGNGNAPGGYFLATLQAGHAADALDPTAILLRYVPKGLSVIQAASVVELHPKQGWRRKFNLLGPVSLFLHATAPIDLNVGGTGAAADFKITPFFTGGANYHEPPFQPSGAVWPIDRGYWVLTVTPRANGKGVLDMTLKPKAVTTDPVEAPRHAAPFFPRLAINQTDDYRVYLSNTGETYGGAALHRLPVDFGDAALGNGLSFELDGGANTSLSVTLPEDGVLTATTEDGKTIPLSVDSKPEAPSPTLGAGQHKLALTAPTGAPAAITLAFTPSSLLATAPLPPLDPARLADIPNFPVIAPGKPVFIDDLERQQNASFDVAVDKAALYRMESTGIIETAGTLRTRTIPTLDHQSANGIGRNFLIQQYLREGHYQLTTTPAGQSYGAVSLSLSTTPVADLGQLTLDLAARATLKPGQAGRYRFHVAEAGDYRLNAIGLHHGFTMRLDDADGWPLVTPGSDADTTLRLAAGDYQMVLLPRPVTSRAVTLLHHIVTAPELSGHGPFPLAFDQTMANRWMEPEAGQPRTPDRWTFTLPAAAEITMTIDNGMRAHIVGPGDDADRIAFAERSWTGTLQAGKYTAEAVSAAPNSRVDYTLTVSPTELLAGQSRQVTAPAVVPVSIGADRQVELASFGGEDVKGRLYDGQGTLVATNDDRDNDWNFLIPIRLQPGRYSLRVDPVGAAKAKTEIRLIQPDEVPDAVTAFGQMRQVADGRIHVVPLPPAKAAGLLVLTAKASAPVGLSVEAQRNGAWVTLGSTTGLSAMLSLPQGGQNDPPLRARVWTIDHGAVPIAFTAAMAVPASLNEKALGAGTNLPPLPGMSGVVAASVKLDQPGVLDLAAGSPVAWSTEAGAVAGNDGSSTIVAEGKNLWLVAASAAHIRASRLDPDHAQSIHLVVRARQSLVLPLHAAKADGTITLWQVNGQGGQPGLGIRNADQKRGSVPLLMATGAASPVLGAAVAMAQGPLANPVIDIWNADGAAEEMPVNLSHVTFDAPSEAKAGFGINDAGFTGRQAQLYALPLGPKRIALVLPVGTVAVPMTGSQPEQMIWTTTDRTDIVETGADHLLLLHADGNAAPFSIGIDPLTAIAALKPGSVLSRYSATPATLHLGATERVGFHLTGSASDATITGADGSVHHSLNGTIPAQGSLAIDYKPGLFALSLDAGSAASPEAPTAITPPQSIDLAGTHMALRLTAGPARLVHIASDTPVLVQAGGIAAGRRLFGQGADLNLLMTADHATDIDIEPAGIAALSGSMRFSSVDLLPMQEGLGRKLRLAPGQSRAFAFILKEKRTVGVGVRASVDIATSRLLRADGTEIGRGLVLMQTLDAGNYVLVVDAPGDGPAIDIQPALVGSVLPDKGPPDDVKAQYMALTGQQSNSQE